MMLELREPLWLQTPKGEGLCHFVIDYGLETELYWVVFIQSSGEVWTFSNIDVRAVKNYTIGRDVPVLKGKELAKAVRGGHLNRPKRRRKKLP